jgi:hypothetical protein
VQHLQADRIRRFRICSVWGNSQFQGETVLVVYHQMLFMLGIVQVSGRQEKSGQQHIACGIAPVNFQKRRCGRHGESLWGITPCTYLPVHFTVYIDQEVLPTELLEALLVTLQRGDQRLPEVFYLLGCEW